MKYVVASGWNYSVAGITQEWLELHRSTLAIIVYYANHGNV